MSTIVLISGANRGLGKGLLARYLEQPNHTVIAANRNPDHATSKALFDLPKAAGSKLVVVKVDANVWDDAAAAVDTLAAQGIDRLDIVIANAGVSYAWPTVADVKPEQLAGHFAPNVYGVVALYQATRQLLRKSTREPVFAVMGSMAGRLNSQPPVPNACYGPSKAAAAWFSARINAEDEWLHSVLLDPGLVRTDLGNAGAAGLGFDEAIRAKAMIGVDESCDGLMKVLAETTKAEHGGKVVQYTGEVVTM